MQIDLTALPDDAAILQLMLRAVVLQQGEPAAETDKLRLLIQRLTCHQFGRRSEQLTPDQRQLVPLAAHVSRKALRIAAFPASFGGKRSAKYGNIIYVLAKGSVASDLLKQGAEPLSDQIRQRISRERWPVCSEANHLDGKHRPVEADL